MEYLPPMKMRFIKNDDICQPSQGLKNTEGKKTKLMSCAGGPDPSNGFVPKLNSIVNF